MEIMYIGVGIFLVWLVRTLHNTHPERVRLSGWSTASRKAKPSAAKPTQGGR